MYKWWSISLPIDKRWDFLAVASMTGCCESCCSEKHDLSPMDILQSHEHVSGLSSASKKQWLLDYFWMNSSGTDTRLLVCGRTVCLPLWLATLDISMSQYYSVRSLFQKGHKSLLVHINRAPMLKTNEAVAWMDVFFCLMGERMPDRGSVHLPSCLSRLSVYSRMVSDLKQRKKADIVCQSQFFHIWRLHFSHVVIPQGAIYITK